MLSSLTQLIADRNISAEIIAVDWASNPAGQSFGNQIAQSCVLFWPVRVIVVPWAIHVELQTKHSETYPNLRKEIIDIRVFIQNAKNVGARRSRGDFLVFINGDTIISPALLMRFEPNTMKKGYVYRAARWEIDVGESNRIDSGLSPDILSAFKRFEKECNIAQKTGFDDLRKECLELCLSNGHCFGLNPRHKCNAVDTGEIPSIDCPFCPVQIGFEEFCNYGVIPDLNDDPEDTVLFSDASGIQRRMIRHLCA